MVYNYPDTVSPISEIIQIDRGIVDFKDTNGSYFQTEIDELNCNYHLWNIQDAKDGDVLATKNGSVFIYNGNYDESNAMMYLGISSDYNFLHTSIPSINRNYSAKLENIVPATESQRLQLFQRLKDKGFAWDAKKKELNDIMEQFKKDFEL